MKIKFDIKQKIFRDKNVFYTIVLRFWLALAGGVTIFVAPLFISEIEQGYYYTFLSLIGLVVLFELGFNQVLIQMIGKEFPFIRKVNGVYIGEEKSLDRITSLTLLINKWYKIGAIFFFLIVTLTGYLFFEINPIVNGVDWMLPWFLLTIGASVNLYYTSYSSVTEGLNQIGKISLFKLKQSTVGYLIMWFLLTIGMSLYAVSAVALIASLSNFVFFEKKFPDYNFFLKRKFANTENKLIWLRDVYPIQWRIALSWISGYFIYQFITPIVFYKLGAIEAGKIGMALNIFFAITTIGISFIIANSSKFAGYVSMGEFAKLDNEHRVVMIKSVFFSLLNITFFFVAIRFLLYYDINVIERLPDTEVMIVLSIASIINILIIGFSQYIHIHGENPLYLSSFVCGISSLVLVNLSSNYNILAVSISYLSLITFILLPWTYLVFKKFKKQRV